MVAKGWKKVPFKFSPFLATRQQSAENITILNESQILVQYKKSAVINLYSYNTATKVLIA